jgi:hypothetical protein
VRRGGGGAFVDEKDELERRSNDVSRKENGIAAGGIDSHTAFAANSSGVFVSTVLTVIGHNGIEFGQRLERSPLAR